MRSDAGTALKILAQQNKSSSDEASLESFVPNELTQTVCVHGHVDTNPATAVPKTSNSMESSDSDDSCSSSNAKKPERPHQFTNFQGKRISTLMSANGRLVVIFGIQNSYRQSLQN